MYELMKAWAKMCATPQAEVAAMEEKALAENAPADAIYWDKQAGWQRWAQVTNGYAWDFMKINYPHLIVRQYAITVGAPGAEQVHLVKATCVLHALETLQEKHPGILEDGVKVYLDNTGK